MNEPTDYDGAWKETLERFLPDFLSLAFPSLHAEIDWSHPFRFLDTELREVVRDAEAGCVRADKLVEVRRRDGTGEWILVHAEVQAQRDDSLAERMFRYYYRILDRFQRPVVSAAVLADPHPSWKPSVYERKECGCELLFRFPICKLAELDLTPWLDAGNPVARVIEAHRVAQSTGNDPERRRAGKLAIVRRLMLSGMPEPAIREVLRLVHWLLALPRPQELVFRSELRNLQQQQNMPYISTYDRLVREEGWEKGLEKGLEKGREEGWEKGLEKGREAGRLHALREVVMEQLVQRFGTIHDDVRERIQGIEDEVRLRSLVKAAFVSPSLESFSQTVLLP